jgi:ElaB/YqjD/DUF883 family membrane-anchored ribosome-binding protein
MSNEPLSRHYEREAETTRRSLANSLNELQDRLTPGQVFDEALTYAKSGSGTFARAFSNAVRENPFPALLIGTGCMLFMSEKMGITKSRPAGVYTASYPATTDTDHGPSIGERAKEKVHSAADTVKQGFAAVGDRLQDTSERVRETAQGMGEGVAEAAERVRQRTQSVAERLTDTAAQTSEQARIASRQVKDKANTLLHEQPMLMAGIGLALGAAIAALIPVTRAENRLMGETSDRVKRRVRDTAAQQFEAAKDTAGELVERAKTVAEREGVTASGAAAEIVRRFGGDGGEEQAQSRRETENGAADRTWPEDTQRGA